MDDGDRLQAAGDLKSALERYRAAHEIMHVPTTGLELARAQAKLGMLVEARRTAIEVANMPVAANEPGVFGEARKAAARLADELEPRVPSLSVVVTPAGLDYALTIDEVALPASARALPFKTNPGEHTLSVQALGYLTTRQSVRLGEAERRSLAMALAPDPQQQVLVMPGAVVPRATDPESPFTSKPAQPVDDPGKAGRLRGFIGLGAGGAFLIAGGVLGVVSLAQTSDIKDRCRNDRCPPDQKDDISRANTLANLSNVGLIVGGLGVGYGLFELLTHWNWNPGETSERASLSLAPEGPGLRLRGQW